ncbi:MAG: hypothetical protein ACR2OZ_16815 [Verrucomicrobiales bacterium]
MKYLTLLRLVPVLLAAPLAACVDQDQKFFLNPDGSGKFVTKMVMTVNPQQLAAFGTTPGKDPGKELLVQILRGTEGVEVWSDVSHEQTADGKTKISATGYFPDINKFKMSAGGGRSGSNQASTLVSKKEGDDWIIEVAAPDLAPSAEKQVAPASKKSPEQIKAVVQQAQQQWQATKGFMAPMVQDAKLRTAVVLGGTIKSSTGFSKESENTALMQFNGTKIIDAIDNMVMDPTVAEEAAAKGGDLMSSLRDQKRMQKVIMESLTDGQGMPRLVATVGSPVFDYKAEVEAAKSKQGPEVKALIEEAKKPGGSVIRPPAGTPPGGAPKGKPVPPAVPNTKKIE